MIGAFDRALTRLEDALLLVSCLCILSIVCITTADVAARGLFNAPFAWSHDLITQYLLVAMFFFSLPYVTRIGGHMALDFLARKVRQPVPRTLLLLLGEILAFLLIAGFIAGAWGMVVDAYRGGDLLAGDLAWPTWPSRLFGPIGGIVLELRLLLRIVQATQALLRGVLPHFLSQSGH